MAKQLLKLRNVPVDELAEIYELLESHEVEFYETSAGNWGISMPALWLVNEEDYTQVRTMLDEYSEQRYQRAREEYQYLKETGKVRTFMDLVRENPFKVGLYIVIVFVLVYFSIAPFINIM
ncbi:MAG: hypothetical protein COA71_07975 [SAR86 cluster bacterium]|uniref:DUF2007 domain-containing protein n=1 Tax=SAR86 cluster bacterium TaxID=2030880 RepID=A0A2A5CCB5_9GAMM|nr:hypothetical protein [Gammaproteobacteria bacterium AH-315-E17]PCJ41487.1 MAG: hypothetical protein COA71_07975 [SAR86 cluster bacterium]